MRGLPFGDVRAETMAGRLNQLLKLVCAALAAVVAVSYIGNEQLPAPASRQLEAYNVALDRCRSLGIRPGPSKDFGNRGVSDRYLNGTKSVLITNARVWTGNNGGKEVLEGVDVCLEGGLISSIAGKGVGGKAKGCRNAGDRVVHDAKGSWVTPGLVSVLSTRHGIPWLIFP